MTDPLKVEYIPPSSLTPYDGNPRIRNDKQIQKLQASIQEYGVVLPVLVNADNVIIAGHAVVRACENLNISEIPCVRASHLTEAQKRAYRLAEDSSWDKIMLKAEMLRLRDDYGVNLEGTGFEQREILRLRMDVAETPKADWREAWKLFPGDVAYIWHASIHGGEVVDSLRSCGFNIRAQIVWAKPNFALSRGDYHWQHECCAYALRDYEDFAGYYDGYAGCWYAVREKGKSHWQGSRSESTLWEIRFNEDTATNHGTQKPFECMRRPMLNNSAPGEVIYEPFCGSGSDIIAADSCRRICYAVELNPEYVDMAVKRFEEYTGTSAILDGTEDFRPCESQRSGRGVYRQERQIVYLLDAMLVGVKTQEDLWGKEGIINLDNTHELSTLRDRHSTFEPQIIPKRSTKSAILEEAILSSMYLLPSSLKLQMWSMREYCPTQIYSYA